MPKVALGKIIITSFNLIALVRQIVAFNLWLLAIIVLSAFSCRLTIVPIVSFREFLL